MEEAERFDWLIAMNAGRCSPPDRPAELKAHTGAPRSRKLSSPLLPEAQRRGHTALQIPPRAWSTREPVIVARDLTCRFGDFTAVDDVSFTIERGEIFGFLGSNGCGKTTTMKMLTGLLPPPRRGAAVRQAGQCRRHEPRYRVGYMSQSFSLYTELTVRQNLDLHAHLFHLPADKAKARIAELVGRFGLKTISTSARWICRWASASGCRWLSPSSTSRRS
jgi:ribosome-dependent ATPase